MKMTRVQRRGARDRMEEGEGEAKKCNTPQGGVIGVTWETGKTRAQEEKNADNKELVQ